MWKTDLDFSIILLIFVVAMIDVYTYSDLKRVTKKNVVTESICIRGEKIKSLNGITEIFGDLGIACPTKAVKDKSTVFEDFGSLTVVHGNLWIAENAGNNVTSLGNIVSVEGDVNLGHSAITDIGLLKNVGGNFSIRNTDITCIDGLLYVGGNALLPKSLKSAVITANICGSTKYYNRMNYNEMSVRPELKFSNGKSIKMDRGWLTPYGKDNEKAIINRFWELIDEFKKETGHDFIYQFYDENNGYCIYKSQDGKYNPYYYEKWLSFSTIKYLTKQDIKSDAPFHRGYYRWQTKEPYYLVVEAALAAGCKEVFRAAENDIRVRNGLKRVGEGWVSETELYNVIKNAFKNTTVVQHGKPEWLGKQHLDVWIPSLNIGVEYQGKQHYSPVEFFGGEETFFKTIERDERKRELCKKNGCKLIEVDENTDINAVIEKIKEYMNVA